MSPCLILCIKSFILFVYGMYSIYTVHLSYKVFKLLTCNDIHIIACLSNTPEHTRGGDITVRCLSCLPDCVVGGQSSFRR